MNLKVYEQSNGGFNYWHAIDRNVPLSNFRALVEASLRSGTIAPEKSCLRLEQLRKQVSRLEIELKHHQTHLHNLQNQSPPETEDDQDEYKYSLDEMQKKVKEYQQRYDYLSQLLHVPPVDDATAKKLSPAEIQQAIVTWHNDDGNTLLHTAAWQGSLDKVQYLVAELGANVNMIDSIITKCTPLHEAVRSSHLEVVRFLLKAGARCDARDASGEVPLHVACRAQNGQIIKLLVDADWDSLDTLRQRNFKQQRPVDLIRRAHRRYDILQLMQKYQQEVIRRDEERMKLRQKEDLKNKAFRKKQKKGFETLRSHLRGLKSIRLS